MKIHVLSYICLKLCGDCTFSLLSFLFTILHFALFASFISHLFHGHSSHILQKIYQQSNQKATYNKQCSGTEQNSKPLEGLVETWWGMCEFG